MTAGRSGRRTATTAVAVVLGLAGAALVRASVDDPDRTPPVAAVERTDVAAEERPSPSASPAERRRPAAAAGKRGGVPDLVAGPTMDESKPLRVEIPRIGVTSRLVDLGLDADGAMEVPSVGAVAGWYSLGPAPGALGPAVIAGHIDWDQAPAVFFRLHTVRRGDRVEVAREDGRTAVFTVTRVARFPKERFPTESVFGSTDHAGLRLITCGGEFDSSERHYLDNIVVFARLVGA